MGTDAARPTLRVRRVITSCFTCSYAKAAAMKFASQIVLAVVAIVGVVAGITYVAQYSTKGSRSPSSDPSQGATANVASLTFPIKIMTFDPPTAGEFEMHAPGHQDFRFYNKNDVPVDLGLMTKSCKCS